MAEDIKASTISLFGAENHLVHMKIKIMHTR